MTDRTDENTLARARSVLGAPTPQPSPPDYLPVRYQPPPTQPPVRPPTSQRSRLLALTAGAVIVAFVAGLAWRATSPAAAPPATTPAATSTPLAGAVVDDSLLGELDGTTDVDGRPTAYTGELVTAPEPVTGEAVGWQWQLCPRRNPGPTDCTAIGGATSQTWSSPPTDEPLHLRVIVTIDLDGVLVRAASATYAALAEQPTPTTPAPTTPAPTTTVLNPFGHPVGSAVAEPAGPASTYALDAARRAVTSPAAASTQVQLLLRWIELRTVGAEAGTVTAIEAGYRISVGESSFDLVDFVVDGDTVTDVTVCLDGTCAAATTAVTVPAACTTGEPGCTTVMSASGATSAVLRGVVTGLGPGPERIYETVTNRPLTTVTLDGVVTFSAGWFLLELPSAPPAGAVTEVAVTYGDSDQPDPLRIGY